MFGFGKKKKKVILVVSSKQYDAGELSTLHKTLKHHHIKAFDASLSTRGPIYGLHQEKVMPKLKYSEVNINDYDGLIFVGGPGAREFLNDPIAHRLIQDANRQKKVIGAIDYAPLILAHAEILNGRKATIIDTEEQKLQADGAIYTGAPVEIDENIVTASQPSYASQFAETISHLVEIR